MTEHRVAVVGAGPAGCAASAALADAGIGVDLFESGGIARDKACGDALLPTAVACVAELHLTSDDLRRMGGRSFTAIELANASDDVLWRTQVGVGWVIPRARLDQALRDALPGRVRLHYQRVVERIHVEASSDEVCLDWRGGQSWTYAGVIVAVGGGSSFARELKLDGQPVHGASLRAYARGTSSDAPRFFLGEPWRAGYAWSFPLASSVSNVGVCALRSDRVKGLARAARAFAERWSFQVGGWKGGAGPLWSGRGQRWHDERGVVTCGDAAGVANPSSGEGITAALETGAAAGRAMAAFIQTREPQELVAYSTWVRRNYATRYPAVERDTWATLTGI